MFRLLGNNLSISAKAFVASAVLLICIAALGVDAFIFLNRLGSDLNALSNVTLPKQRALLEITRRAADVHVDVFRYVAWSSNGVNQATMDTLAREIDGHAQAVERGLAAFAERHDLSPPERLALSAATVKWRRFVTAAHDTLEIGATDPALGSLMLGGTDEDYARAAADLQNMFRLASEHTRAAADELVEQARINKELIAVGGVIAVVLGLGVMLLVVRSLVRPIKSVTRAMRAISLGHADVDLGVSTREDEIGQMVNAIAVFRDKIESDNRLLAARETELVTQNMRFDAALNNMSQGLAMFDREHRLIVCNARYAEVYDLPLHLLGPGTRQKELLHYLMTEMLAGPNPQQYVSTRLECAISGRDSDHLVELRDGRVIAVSHRTMADGGWVSTHEDVTERHRVEQRISHMAKHDALTDLPNRVLFREEMESALREASHSKQLAVICMDLDYFKEVNDSLGHPAGDALLRAVAARLKNCVGRNDTIARLGGDEFAVLRPAVTQPEELAAFADRIVSVLGEPYKIEGHEVIVGTSVGMALAPGDGTSPDQLLKNADLALYRAKADGRRGHRFFESEMDARVQLRRKLEMDLRAALTFGQFEVHYQPILSSETLQVSAFEALLRWRHPERGLVPPIEFIPLAEEIGLIQSIGEWVLREACTQAAQWPPHIRVAVNVSSVQFKRRTLIPTVLHALAASGLAANRLELEITESVLLTDNDATLSSLQQLHALGVRISLDDFGTGYSSLRHLRSFPFDTIKIDRSFVQEMGSRSDSTAIVEAIVQLAAKLGTMTTAEGIETPDQLELVKLLGCGQVQGYLFSRPVAASAVQGLIPLFSGAREGEWAGPEELRPTGT